MSPSCAPAFLLAAAAANGAAVVLVAVGRRRKTPADRAREDAEQARLVAGARQVDPGRRRDARR